MPVPKASRTLIQTMACTYLQQLYALQLQLRQQTAMLPNAAQGAELPCCSDSIAMSCKMYRNRFGYVRTAYAVGDS